MPWADTCCGSGMVWGVYSEVSCSCLRFIPFYLPSFIWSIISPTRDCIIRLCIGKSASSNATNIEIKSSQAMQLRCGKLSDIDDDKTAFTVPSTISDLLRSVKYGTLWGLGLPDHDNSFSPFRWCRIFDPSTDVPCSLQIFLLMNWFNTAGFTWLERRNNFTKLLFRIVFAVRNIVTHLSCFPLFRLSSFDGVQRITHLTADCRTEHL